MQQLLEEARLCGDIAQLLHNARVAAGLTQVELARRLGTSQSAVSRLGDADYDGHSLAMIGRVAKALDLEVKIALTPKDQDAA